MTLRSAVFVFSLCCPCQTQEHLFKRLAPTRKFHNAKAVLDQQSIYEWNFGVRYFHIDRLVAVSIQRKLWVPRKQIVRLCDAIDPYLDPVIVVWKAPTFPDGVTSFSFSASAKLAKCASRNSWKDR